MVFQEKESNFWAKRKEKESESESYGKGSRN